MYQELRIKVRFRKIKKQVVHKNYTSPSKVSLLESTIMGFILAPLHEEQQLAIAWACIKERRPSKLNENP